MAEYYIALGAPGCGKGTLCAKLKENKEYYQLSTGDLLRSEVKAQTQLGQQVESIMKSGGLVSDDLIITLVQHHLQTLQGYKYVENVDDVTGEPLIQRADDNEATVRSRLEEYYEKTAPLVEYYSNKIVKINGEEDMDLIRASVTTVIEARANKRSRIPGYQGHIPGCYSENQYGVTYGQLINKCEKNEQYQNGNPYLSSNHREYNHPLNKEDFTVSERVKGKDINDNLLKTFKANDKYQQFKYLGSEGEYSVPGYTGYKPKETANQNKGSLEFTATWEK